MFSAHTPASVSTTSVRRRSLRFRRVRRCVRSNRKRHLCVKLDQTDHFEFSNDGVI